jgi:hypothetical protein
LRDDISGKFAGRKAFANDKADRYSRVKMAAGDMTDRECHGKDRESEGESDTGKADTELWKGGGEDGTAATSEDKPESTKELCGCTFVHRHREYPLD